MTNNFEDLKINVRSLLTISQKSLSIEQLQKDYLEHEGENIPYKRFGFNSTIELLQNMQDVLTLPPNPNIYSTLSVIVDDKTSHLRMLVIKQKSNVKRKNKSCSSINNRSGSYTNYNRNGSFHKNNSYNNKYSGNNSYNNYQHSNTRNNNYKFRFNSNLNNNNNSDQPTSSYSKHNSDLNINQDNSGYVTDELRNYLKQYISKNQKLITMSKLEELIRNHPDFPTLKSNNILNCVQDFLNINKEGVTLKNTHQLEANKNIQLTNHIKVLTNNKYQDDSDIISSINERMTNGTLEECVKSQLDISKKKNNETRFSNGLQSEYSLDNTSGMNSLTSFNTFSHSIPKLDSSKVIKLNKYIPREVLFNIGQIFMVYHRGVSIKNFLFIYNKVYHTVFDPAAYGFTSFIELFKALDGIIKIKDKVLYSKIEVVSKFPCSVDGNNDNILTTQKNIKDQLLLNYNLKISLNIDQQLLPNEQTEMKLVEAFSPNFFYLQLSNKVDELDHLMNQMQHVYDKDNISYYVQSECILLGSIYASPYPSSQTEKYWRRVRVLKEVNSTTVSVSQVDYGIIYSVLKTELRYLNQDFSHLPCQAIHCSLTNYNELNTIAPEVLTAFLYIIDNKPVIVQIDESFIFNKECSVLHVTLFQHHRNNKYKLQNINDELYIKLKINKYFPARPRKEANKFMHIFKTLIRRWENCVVLIYFVKQDFQQLLLLLNASTKIQLKSL